MPGMKRFRRNGREEPISLDDEMFRLLPEDGDPTLDRDDDWGRGRSRDDLDFGDGDMDYAPGGSGDLAARFGERRSVMTLLSALVILVVVAGVVWYLVLGPAPGSRAPDETQAAGDPSVMAVPAAPSLPVVFADTEPYKVRPDDPGGLKVQNTGMRVYDRLGDGAAEDDGPAVEQLLPRPSAPVTPPAPPPAAPEPPPRVAVAATSAEPGPAPTPAPAPDPTSAPAPDTGSATAAPVAEPDPLDANAPATTPSEPATTAPTPPPENVTVTALRGPQVQLAAFRERRAAEATWDRLAEAHPDLLGRLPHAVVFADLGDLGRFYRLRAGPLASGEAAEQLCRSLKQRDVECLVVRE